jgi:hypothetical protein
METAVPEPVLHDDWPRPRFLARFMYLTQTEKEVWAVWDRVYNFRLIAKGPEWVMEDLADDLERDWLAEDARAAAAA